MSINQLPLDILKIILLQLPVKSLLRFKIVDISWNAIISDHDFAKKHLRQSQNATDQHNLLWRPVSMNNDRRCHLFNFENNKSQVEALPRYPNYPGKLLCSTDDGLFLFGTRRLILLNSSNGTLTAIPCPHRFNADTTAFGFCRGPTLDDYKIVATCGEYYTVYSCNYRYWNMKKEFPYGSRYVWRGEVAYVDGFSFWIMSGLGDRTLEILYFDPRDDTFKRLQKPRKIEGFGDYFSVTSLKGCLGLYHTFSGTVKQFRIWIVRDRIDVDYNSWRELVTMD